MTVPPSQTRLCSRLRILAYASGAFAIAIGLMVLGGWWAQIDALKRILPGMVSMNPVTAVCFVLSGISLIVQVVVPPGKFHRSAQLLGLAIFASGGLKLGYYMGGWRFPVDQWIFHDQLQPEGPGVGNQIAPNTAFGFVLLGAALLLLDRTKPGKIRVAEILALMIALVSMLALIGYVYQVSWLYGVSAHLPMALHTALAFVVMSLGILFARPDQGLMEAVTGDSSGGLLARRMFPAMVLVFVFAGGLRLIGERRGYYEAELGVVLYTVVSIAVFGIFVIWCARSLHQADLARKQVEEERERFFRLSLDLMGTAGMDGYFKRINPAFTRTLGYTTEEILALPFLDFVHPEDVASTLAEMETLSSGKPTLHFENRYRCKDGSWKWLEWNTQPFAEERILYATARDISEQKKAELAILELNAELLQQTARLESVNQELESFSYSVSHDLRAPLRGISGFALALEEHAAEKLDVKGHGYLQRVQNAAERMGHLIDDLLKLSRLSRAEMKMELVDLSELARSLAAGYRSSEPEREVEVIIAQNLLVLGDPALLRILLDNLMGNAWKFTSKNPAARIEVGCNPVDGSRTHCFVKDNGVGFDKRYAHKLFGAFQRLHSQVEFPGTGIGLATVQRIVRRHGGEVLAEGEINHGATFGFTLEAVSQAKSP